MKLLHGVANLFSSVEQYCEAVGQASVTMKPVDIMVIKVKSNSPSMKKPRGDTNTEVMKRGESGLGLEVLIAPGHLQPINTESARPLTRRAVRR